MAKASAIPFKYVYLDVVKFTYKRSVEAQSDIISALNDIVRNTVETKIESSSPIYIPVGDGICIAFDGRKVEYDAHIIVASEIIRRVNAIHNPKVSSTRKFEVRIGINDNIDNLITDINGRRNVCGAGVNEAQRIMNLSDPNQIFVGISTYESLRPREKYSKAFRAYEAPTKHGIPIKVFQYIGGNVSALNRDTPSAFTPEQPAKEPMLTKLAAYYFAHAIKNKQFIMTKTGSGQKNYALMLLLYYLAKDSVEASQTSPFTAPTKWMPETSSGSIIEQRELFMDLPFTVCHDLTNLALDFDIGSKFNQYYDDRYYRLSINEAGRKKLKSEWPRIWDEFNLDMYT